MTILLDPLQMAFGAIGLGFVEFADVTSYPATSRRTRKRPHIGKVGTKENEHQFDYRDQ